MGDRIYAKLTEGKTYGTAALNTAPAEKKKPRQKSEQTSELSTLMLFPDQYRKKRNMNVLGIYLTAYYAGNERLMEKAIRELKRTGCNMIVVDVKDEGGVVTFYPTGPSADKFPKSKLAVTDIPKLIARLKRLKKEENYEINLAVRICVFKDPRVADSNPELQLKPLSPAKRTNGWIPQIKK
jgi:hypothetical protein